MTIEWISGKSVSEAWGKTLLALTRPGTSELIPLVVNINIGGEWSAREDSRIRRALDALLVSKDKPATITTANLIFPTALWERYRAQGTAFFFEHFRDVTAPRLRQADRKNSRGTYFERLVAYGPERRNQLADMLAIRKQTSRRSVMQAVVFDPATDQTGEPYLKFPCLDYVAFAPDVSGGLSVSAFYATQYVFDRAFGNYVGLCALGTFMAEQLGLTFRQLTCVSGVAQLGDIGKGELKELAAEIEVHVQAEAEIAG